MLGKRSTSLGKRSTSLLLFLAMLMSLLVSAPAAAQETPEPPSTDATFAELSAGDEFKKVLLTPDVPEPMTMDIAPDGRVFTTSRDGVIRIYHPDTEQMTVAAELNVFDEHPLPSDPDIEGSKNQEGGLLGLALDPDFETNGWVYVYYTSTEEKNHFLSRFVVQDNKLDTASETVLLKVPYNKTNCCHVAGDLEFDSAGNLYLSTGDESTPDLNDQYSPLDSRPTHWYNDDRRTSGNTNDLRGKILRITPQDDGTYTIPENNLFPPAEYDQGLTRPEIYAMGFRNPFRISIDPATDRLHIGNYGPDRLGEWDERGPWGFDQYMVTSEPANFGYPFCIGNNYPYRKWDYATNQPRGGFYDCESGPINDSPNNTGLEQLPPVKPATIYYPRSWAGWPEGTWPGSPDQPVNPIPEPFLNMGTGAGGPMSGPVYRYDENLESDTKFPEHYDGRWFLMDYHRGHIKTAALDENEKVTSIEDFMPGTTWSRLMDGQFGPDGSFYVLEGGGFGPSADAGLYRIDYVKNDAPPLDDCVVDDFSGSELDRDMWSTIVRENPDAYRQVGGALEIDMLQGDMISNHLSGNVNTEAQNLILTQVPDEPWVAEVTVDLPENAIKHDQAGFIIYADDQNFTKAAFFPPVDGQADGRFEYLYHENGEIRYQSGVDNPTIANAPLTLSLRLTSDGANVTAEYSRDGETWINVGRPAPISQYENPKFGFFAAHGPNEIENPLTAKFTDFSLCAASDVEPPACEEPTVDAGYRPLWDGATLDGWKQAGPGGFDIVADADREGTCALESVGDPEGLGMLWFDEQFESYRLHLDFKAVAENDNSGVFFGFPNPGDDPWIGVHQGYEIQIDDTGGWEGAPPSSMTGSIYTFQGPTSFPTVPGQWNEMEIEVDAPMVRVWINDVLVNEYENPEGSGRDLTSGYIGIQNNRVSDNVFFRDIWVKELTDELTVDASVEPVEPDGANGWYVSPVTLSLASNNPDAELQWRPRTDESVWRTWTEPVVFDSDGIYNIDYRAVLPGDDGEPAEKEILVGENGFDFSESEFSVQQGDTVKFQYVPGYAHDVVITDENGEVLASRPLGSDWEDDPFLFEAADVGTYYVYCTPHSNRPNPDDPTTWTGMVSTFEVTPSSGAGEQTGIEEIEFLIDQTAPSTEASVEGEQAGDVFTGAVTVNLAAQDATSGAAQTQYRMAGEQEPTVYNEPFVVTDPGDHTVEFRSVDLAGHVEDWQQVNFTIGRPGPCPEPDPRETVVIGDVDSHVANHALADGCTINDLINDEGEWPNKGAFMKHVKDVTSQLVADGVITRQERGKITSAAAQSDAGRGGGPNRSTARPI
jgi:glucose/arabinose dehydrogenase/plastocyanin/regulation of enolase protein 1 (concanavalin A-like superfamily)